MKLNVSKGAHVNYLAKIVYVNKFTPHPNPEYTKLKVAHIVGYQYPLGDTKTIHSEPNMPMSNPTQLDIIFRKTTSLTQIHYVRSSVH